MSSKFWNASDSESSESGSQSDAEEHQPVVQPKKQEKTWSESSSDESVKRQVRSEKDKRWQEFKSLIGQTTAAMGNDDYMEIQTQVEKLAKMVGKSDKLFAADGTPKFLIRALVQIMHYVEEKHDDKAALKKVSKQKAQAINKLHRTLPKSLENVQEQMEKCREDPDAFQSDEGELSDDETSESESSSESESESELESESEESAAESESEKSSASGGESSSSSSPDEWSMSSSESEVSDAASVSSLASDVDYETRHARALVKWGYEKPKEGVEEIKEDKEGKRAKRRAEQEQRRAAKTTEEEALEREAPKQVVLLPDGEQMDEASVLSATKEIVASRNKRGVEKAEQLGLLRRLLEIATNKNFPNTVLEILNSLITLGLDTVQASGLPPNVSAWGQLAEDMWQLFALLCKDDEARLRSGTDTEPSDAKQDILSTASMTMSFLDRMHDGLFRGLQSTDPHSKEYNQRLFHTVDLLGLLWVARSWYARKAQKVEESLPERLRTAIRLIEHTYYLSDRVAMLKWRHADNLIAKHLGGAKVKACDPCPIENPFPAFEDLCHFVFSTADSDDVRSLFKAQICLVYAKALNADYYGARDLFSTGPLNDIANSLDVQEQILYNRAVTQLGLAAFKQGLIQPAAMYLNDICGSNKHRELLAQGVAMAKGFEKTAEQERAERRRLLPAFMHINLDVVEGFHNICSMLLEVPTMCNPNADSRQRQSRFKRALDMFENTHTLPESSKEVVLAAAQHLQKGEWTKCRDYIMSLRCWGPVQPVEERARVQALVIEAIKSAALKCYILTYSKLYDAISVRQISAMFDVSVQQVYSTVSKMIVNAELPEFWDAESENILVNKIQATDLQKAALGLVDQLSSVLDQHEALLSTSQTVVQPTVRRMQKHRS